MTCFRVVTEVAQMLPGRCYYCERREGGVDVCSGLHKESNNTSLKIKLEALCLYAKFDL